MDPTTTRAEAERWLAIAAKLLAARDFNGSKTFAIRARDSDPNNLVSDQILSVVDTLIAADKSSKIGESSSHLDWYAVLQLPPLSRDLDLIASQYRRLVLLLNPERNRLPFADYALRLVVEAWSVLSDPTKKWLYDGEMSLFLQQQQQRVEVPAAVRVEAAPAVANNQVNTFQFFQQQPMQTQQQQTVNHVLPQQQTLQPQPMQPQQWQQRGVEVQHVAAPQQQQPMQPQQWQQRHQEQIEQQQQQHEQLQLQEMWQRQQQQRLQQQQQQQQHLPQQQEQPGVQQLQKEWHWEQLQPPAPPSQHQQPQVRQEERETVQHKNEIDSERNEGADAIDENGNVDDNVEIETFWTACPYCLYMYEYARDYEGCTLRCQNCRRGFHAAEVPNPPPIGDRGGMDSKEASFCCWGFYPMGFSMTKWKRNHNLNNSTASWVPFSPMFACPVNGNGNAGGVYVNAALEKKKSMGRKLGSAPRFYVDDDDVYVDISDSGVDSDSSDDQDWRKTKNMKTKKKVKKAGRRGRVGRKPKSLKESAYQGVIADDGALGGDDSQVRSQAADGAAAAVATGVKSDAGKRPGSSNTRKQMGRAAKDRGKLDLNVEVSNEVEDHGPAVSAGNGQEEPIEGIAFFEGLDEFLSSLPILKPS